MYKTQRFAKSVHRAVLTPSAATSSIFRLPPPSAPGLLRLLWPLHPRLEYLLLIVPSQHLLFLSVLCPQCLGLVQTFVTAYLTATIAPQKVLLSPRSTPHTHQRNLYSTGKMVIRRGVCWHVPCLHTGGWFCFVFCQPVESWP